MDAPFDDVPFYGLVGYGRVGRALAAYLETRQIPFRLFRRSSPIIQNSQSKLISEIVTSLSGDSKPKVLLLALSDPSLMSFVEELKETCSHRSVVCPELIHFSGSVQIEGVNGFHPLYSFTDRALSVEEFESIPFNVDPNTRDAFRKLLPSFRNPVCEMSHRKGALYHALCVSLGNLPQYVQNSSLKLMKEDFELPPEALLPFLRSLLRNLEEAASQPSNNPPQELISGPIARKDSKTIARHLEVLAQTSPLLHDLYQNVARQEGVNSGETR